MCVPLNMQVRAPSLVLHDIVGGFVAGVAMAWAILTVYLGQLWAHVDLHTGPNQVQILLGVE